MDIAVLKTAVIGDIDGLHSRLAEISHLLHDNPEVAFKERRAAGLLTDFLAGSGFKIEKGICKLPTAFKAKYGGGKPVIAFLAEYDALPGLGHACGHNLIATASLAAAVACKPAVDTLGGAVVVFGTPGEELYGGKSTMAAAGAFDGIDAAMISHPGGGNRILMNTLACENLEVKFKGAAAHAAAAPELGINALDAMILSFNAINALRQQLRSCERVSGVITNGGEAANIIPEHTAAIFILRAEDGVHLDALKKKVIACFAGASRTTGAKLKYSWGERYEAMVSNVAMAKLFRENMRSLGQNIDLGDKSLMYFSTDVGNVSQLAPTIQPLVAIAPEGVLIHTPRFAKAAATGEALRCMLDAAKAMAMTAIDLFSSPEKMAEVQKEFFKDK